MSETSKNFEQIDLNSAASLYNDTLLRTSIRLLRNKGVKNAETIGPDMAQEAYLSLLPHLDTLPKDKSGLLHLLQRAVVTRFEDYIRDKFQIGEAPQRKIREVDLVSIDKAKKITVPPNQEKKSLNNIPLLINNASNLTALQKQVLISHYVEGKSFDEISQEREASNAKLLSKAARRGISSLKKNSHFIDSLG